MEFLYENHFIRVYPKIGFFYYAILTVMAFTFTTPTFISINISAMFIYLIFMTGIKKATIKAIYLLPMVVFIAAVNPLFNHSGQTPLLYVNDKPFTLESLIYGIITGLLLASVFLLFETMQENLNGDKIIFIFSKHFPIIALMLSMIFKISDDLKKQLTEISQVQKTMGVSTSSGAFKNKLKSGGSILSCLVSVSLENSLDTAISMKSRGFGVCKKTNFDFYKIKKSDIYLAAFMIIDLMLTIIFYNLGNFKFTVFPGISKINFEINNILCYVFYGIFVNIPILFNLKEDIKWHFLKSKI